MLIINWEWVGGAQGISGPAVPRTVLDLSFISAMPYYYIFLAVLAAILFLTWRIENEPHGLLPARHQGFASAPRARSASPPAATSSTPTC